MPEQFNLRLVFGGPPRAMALTLKRVPAPSMLVSFVYLRQWLEVRPELVIRDWVMDCGAWTALQKGRTISLPEYVDKCAQQLASDPKLVEVFALDVIGDWHATLTNTERMWAAGIPAIPTFHIGEPWHVLHTMVAEFNKVAIGGSAGMSERAKLQFASQVFARVWPHRIHGFGYGALGTLMQVPFHSADASSWEIGPTAYGRWGEFGMLRQRMKANDIDLRSQVVQSLAIEDKVRARWARVWQEAQHALRGDAGGAVRSGTPDAAAVGQCLQPVARPQLDG